jgi:hypothetical protein
MSIPNRSRSLIRASAPRRRRGILAVMLIDHLCGCSAFLHAEPVTFRFDAMITTVSPGIPFDAGVQFALGDTISGEFTFDPAEVDGGKSFSAIQPYEFILHINGVSLATPRFEIEAINNLFIISDCPAGVDCLSGFVDELIVGGAGLAGVENEPALGFEPSQSGFCMLLAGTAIVLGLASHPPTADVWNDFDLRRQIAVFFEDGSGGTMAFGAAIGKFKTIPEPPSTGLGTIVAALMFLNCRWRA